ncbi:NAD(P)-binding protein [Dendrothele bispora CBS 962.96]|uniref:NAD(P)-binding protein n=1 Tax=Dendrothele bispora (strain CBS 962.96) TaxID=1314807 RepID=A0A4S8M5H5_DENBC|nr:NAD(P)-binding protein [Dendrothele bispora CBS 962.96]
MPNVSYERGGVDLQVESNKYGGLKLQVSKNLQNHRSSPQIHSNYSGLDMKVLVLGASGFIGFSVCQALSRAGYVVYGQTRSSDKVQTLAAEEIIPVVCDPDSDKWHHLVPTLDVVIDCLRASSDRTYTESLINAFSQAAKSLRPAGSPKLSYIYTSATGVHGTSDNGEIITDTTPCLKPTETAGWLRAHEENILTHEVLNGIVIRPSLLYGRSGSLFSVVFEEVKKTGKVRWPGKPGGRLSVIHQDDLADLYLRAAEKAQMIGGMTFDAANDVTESVDGFLMRLAQVVGVEGYEYRKPEGFLDLILSQSYVVRPYLARSLLGWQPRKTGVTDGLAVYYNAYLGSVA